MSGHHGKRMQTCRESARNANPRIGTSPENMGLKRHSPKCQNKRRIILRIPPAPANISNREYVQSHVRCQMPLEKELAQFEKMKSELLKNHEGKFVLIRGEEFIGTFDSAENAYGEGVKRFGRDPFLIKKVTEREEVYRNQALYLGLM